MKVRLKCQWDNGEKILPPGSETELERDQALALADMGMVEIIPKEAPAKPVKPSTATKPSTASSNQTRKAKAAEARAKAAEEKARAAQVNEAEGNNDSEDLENENQDPENGSADPDEIPDPDSLME